MRLVTGSEFYEGIRGSRCCVAQLTEVLLEYFRALCLLGRTNVLHPNFFPASVVAPSTLSLRYAAVKSLKKSA